MTTSMGPSFSGHPAGMGHPGVAGHPMGPGGMPHNPGQQGAPGGMPHQFGGPMVSAPGAQVNPALMGGMPPGANPNAHALQHLNPAAQQQMLQQQLQQQHCMYYLTSTVLAIPCLCARANWSFYSQ